MTLEDLYWYFYLESTYVCLMKYIERFRVGICDASMNIVIYMNELPKFIFTMFKQRIRNWLNNFNRGLRMRKLFTLKIFGYEEVLCMIKMLQWCDASVYMLSLAIHSISKEFTVVTPRKQQLQKQLHSKIHIGIIILSSVFVFEEVLVKGLDVYSCDSSMDVFSLKTHFSRTYCKS